LWLEIDFVYAWRGKCHSALIFASDLGWRGEFVVHFSVKNVLLLWSLSAQFVVGVTRLLIDRVVVSCGAEYMAATARIRGVRAVHSAVYFPHCIRCCLHVYSKPCVLYICSLGYAIEISCIHNKGKELRAWSCCFLSHFGSCVYFAESSDVTCYYCMIVWSLDILICCCMVTWNYMVYDNFSDALLSCPFSPSIFYAGVGTTNSSAGNTVIANALPLFNF
jgi:hypothetical protein